MKRFVLHTFLTLLLALGFGGSLFARKIVFNAAYDRAEYDLTKESVRIRVTNGNLALNISSDGKIYRYSTYLVKSGGALVFEVLSDNEIITEISIEYEGGSSHTFQCCKTEDKWTNPSSYSAKISKITVTLMSLISDLSELELLYGRLGREYLIHTKKEARGSLGVANGELASTNPKAQGHKCDEAMPFLIHPFNDKYFLYSVTDDKFITKTGGETDRPLLDDLWTLTKNANGYFMFKVANNYLNVNNNPGIQINSRGEEETQWDDGNQFSIQPTDYTYSDISYIFYDRGSYFWPIDFLDDNVKAICVAKWDIDGDEELSEIEAASVTDLENVFRNTDITSFDELQYFTGLTSIDNEAFSGCSSLTSITIPESVTTIGNYAFSGCKSLTSITIPESVTNIGDHAFSGCSSLIWVPIPKNVTNISDYTFSGCESLEDVSIPKSVTNIGSHAFSGCESLECVFCYAEQVPNADESSFADSNMSGAVLFVPAVSYDAYRETAPWSNFGYIDPMTSIKLDRSELPLTYRGEKVQLHAIILPENATYEDVTWTSSNESVAVVDKNGNVTAVGNGTAVITAIFITDYENITVSCTVYVNIDYTIYATKIHLDQSQCIMNHEGEEVQLKATIEPEIATYKDVMWTSSNESVATVDENGLVTAVGNGDAVITATTIDGTNLSATCKVIVYNVVFKTFTLRCARGYVGYNGSALYGTTSKEAASEFAIVDYGDTNYLYDVTNKAFVIHSTAAMAGTNGNRSLESSTYFAAAVTGLTWGKTGFEDYPWYLEDYFGNWLNMDGNLNVNMNTWKDFEDGEGGNTYQVEIVNDWFVAYEALEMLDSYFFDRNIISDLSELSNSKQYIICTKDEARGALGVANGELASTNPEAQGHKCEEASAFAILQYDGNYYLYSTADRKFITNTGGETDAPGLDGTHAVTVTKNANGGYFMFSFTSTGNVININDKPGIDINTWGQTEDNWDDGNQFTIDEAGDFDPTEALAMFVVDNTPNVKGKTFTLCCARGYVGYNGSTLCSTTQEAASEFAIVDYEDSNYLYDVTNKAFVIHTTAAKAGLSGNRLLESQTDFSKAVTGLSWGKTGIATYPWYLEDSFTNWLNMGSLKDVNMNTWKDFQGGNGGNTYQVEIVNENFDATEAIQMLDRYFHPISISSITLDTTSEILTAIGQTVQLTPTIVPDNATLRNVTWTSSNESVAVVDENGLVKALGNGIAVITATTVDGTNLSASCTVSVDIDDNPIIDFADVNVKAICVANWDSDGDGELSKKEAAAVTDLGDIFINNTEITSFDELQYFTGLTSIGNSAFFSCYGLTSIVIPNSVTNIGDQAFANCGLTSVNIPESVVTIGAWAFNYCYNITAVTIPENVTSIGVSAFQNCNSLVTIIVEQGNIRYDSRDNCNAIIETATNTLIAGCKNSIIPESVTSIGSLAFYGCNDLTSIVIPNSVTNIGYQAFAYCGLTSVNIPESVVTIGGWAFDSCFNLTAVTIPRNVTSIDYGVFSGCNSLSSIIVEGGNSRYDSRDNCNAIIETATSSLISGCNHTIIPENVTSIGNWALAYCDNLNSIVIPESVTSIAYGAFCCCYNLTSITILGKDISIGEDAFVWCNALRDIYCYAERIPNTLRNAFGNSNIESATLHVPAVSLDAYMATTPWSNFGNIVAIDDNTPNVTGKTFTLRCARGYVGYNGSTLCSTTQEAASEFAIVDYGTTNYLYDVTNKAFVIHSTAAMAEDKGNRSLESSTYFAAAVTGLTWGKTGFEAYPWYLEDSFTNWMNMDGELKVCMNTWKDFEGGNGGNTYQVDIVSTSFDATEAIQMLDNYFQTAVEVTDEQYQAALNSVGTDTQYAIYTLKGGTRYYLTSEGYLTAHPTRDCVLTFASTEGDGLFRSPGWKVDACFTNPHLSENGGESGALLPQGHILTDSQGRDDWDGQVWYLGDNGCYAVRATNAVSDTWGANTYWTVLDTNGDGVPEADYSWAPAFVWQLESDVVSVGIRDIDNGQSREAGAWYTLDGRKLSGKPATKGIFIQNSKKVVVR